jgi:hypothetical protein
LALAGLIDAGYGLDEAWNGETPGQRKEGITRTVFGLLNALPLAGVGEDLRVEGAESETLSPGEHIVVTSTEGSVAAPSGPECVKTGSNIVGA